MIRSLLLLFGLGITASAQLQLYTVTPAGEQTFDTFLNLGSDPVGDFLDTRMRLRNVGSQQVILNQLAVTGLGFTLNSMPALPYPIPPQTSIDFYIRFFPQNSGLQTASLAINSMTVILEGTGTGAAVLYSIDSSGSRTAIPSGTAINLGTTARGSTSTVNLVAVNGTAGAVSLGSITVSGDGFSLSSNTPSSVTLAPKQEQAIQLVFAPNKTQKFAGTFMIDKRSWPLTGTEVEPTFPNFTLSVDSATAQSAQQVGIHLGLSSPAPTAASGRVQLSFQPFSPGIADDSVIVLTGSGIRTLSFTVAQGETGVHFGTQSIATLQTGTTSGTITITAQLGPNTQTTTVTIPPLAPVIDQTQAVRSDTTITLIVDGYDNTHSTSLLRFVFYDKSGNVLTVTPIQTDATTAFKQFFGTSTMGGQFALTAVFPVTGSTNAIGAMDVEVNSSGGTTKTAHLTIP